MSATERTPAFVPEGFDTHLEYVLTEAEAAFLKGHQGDGIVNLAHAVYVAVTKREEMDQRELSEWFARVTRAAKAWEL